MKPRYDLDEIDVQAQREGDARYRFQGLIRKHRATLSHLLGPQKPSEREYWGTITSERE